MTLGIATQDASANLLMYSPNMNGTFFRGAGTFNQTATIQDSTFTNTFAICTPLDPAYIGIQYVNCAGSVSVDGKTYNQPSPLLTAQPPHPYAPSWFDERIGTTQSAYVHYFGTPPASIGNYGFRAAGSLSSTVAVDNNYKSIYVHPDSNGNRIRTGTAYSIASHPRTDNQIPVGTYVDMSQPVSQTITFDKPYNNPPLIFILTSTGAISFNYMVKDANGKFIGASIVAESTFSAVGNGVVSGVGAYTGNTFTFTYFIVSDEDPVYVSPSDWGVRIFGSNSNKIFDSSYFVPSFDYLTIPMPYMRLDYTSGYTYDNYAGFGKSNANIGICINNLNSFTGTAMYNSWNVDAGSGSVFHTGPRNVTGLYLNVDNYSGSIYASGTAASTFCLGNQVNFPYYTEGGLTGRSYQFTVKPTDQLNVIYASVSY